MTDAEREKALLQITEQYLATVARLRKEFDLKIEAISKEIAEQKAKEADNAAIDELLDEFRL